MIATITKRAHALERDGRPDALAWLDAAYLVEAIREVASLDQMSNNTPFRDGVRAVAGLTAGADGYTLILKSLEVRPGDLSLEFAAALIVARETGSAGNSPKYERPYFP